MADGWATQAVGWAASATLIATIAAQNHKQWKERSTEGVSKWLFLGQMAASVLFLVYSALIRGWVYVFTNAVMLVNGLVGYLLLRHFRRQGGH